MARKSYSQLQTELDDALDRVDELEEERDGILDALGIEMVEEAEGDDDGGDDENPA